LVLGFAAQPFFKGHRAARHQRHMMGKRMSVLHKTKLCKFNVIGECNRGHKCGFAHSAAELQPVPDLSRTKMCPVLSKAGTCDDSNCRYAHETVQRRKKAFVYFGKGVVSKPRYCVPDAQHDASAYSTNNDVAQVGAELCQDDAEQTISSDDAGMHFWDDDVSTCGFSWTPQTSAGSSSQDAVDMSGHLVVLDKDCLQSAHDLTDRELHRLKRADKLRRTKMCECHRVGFCSQGAACTCKHIDDELRPALDLQCSRVCWVLSHKQVLADMSCESICVESDIRTCNQDWTSPFLPNRESAFSHMSPQCQQSPHIFEWPCEDGIMVVKSTFLSVEPEQFHLRRVTSAPVICFATE